MQHKGKLVVCAIAVVIIAWMLWPDRRSPEARIRAVIEECVAAARKGDAGGIMEHVADHFRGEVGEGNVSDRAELKAYLLGMMLRGGSLDVRVLSEEVTLRGEGAAQAVLLVVLTRGGISGAADGNLAARHLELDLEELDGDWKIVASRHRPADPAELL